MQQAITIKTEPAYKAHAVNIVMQSKYHIGQKVFTISHCNGLPVILEANVLLIGIESVFQTNDLVYIIDRKLQDSEIRHKFYENDLYSTKLEATNEVVRRLEKAIENIKAWQEMNPDST